ncbi:MAG: hypothetical protein LLG14_10745 [Nocardiaceae bacterium]|nr:hypothetical protein [Nocardiaceae bacterium]
MTKTFDGDPVDAHEARELRQLISIEMDRVHSFIGKIESSIRNTSSVQHAHWLRSQSDRQTTELRRLGRMAEALKTRFGH